MTAEWAKGKPVFHKDRGRNRPFGATGRKVAKGRVEKIAVPGVTRAKKVLTLLFLSDTGLGQAETSGW